MIKKVIGIVLIVFSCGIVFASAPKNVILMIADGAGFNHLAAADCYKYDKVGKAVYENFPVRLKMTTYPLGEAGITDSAAAATAMACGVKTKNGCIGIDANGFAIENIIERFEKIGRSTGIVTTVPFCHATPAGFVVHDESRGNYHNIAFKMLEEIELEVIFGCGNPYYDDDGQKLSEPKFEYISEPLWRKISSGSFAAAFITRRADIIRLATGSTPARVVGIAEAASTLQQKRSGKSKIPYDTPFNENLPTFAQFSRAALNILDENRKGFFLMLEGGAVDWASHSNDSARMLEEMLDFEQAVSAVIQWLESESSWQDCLLIITADHETGDLQGSGKGGKIICSEKGKMPQMNWNSKGHTNQPVFFFAKGAGANEFQKLAKNKCIDNTDIAKVLFMLAEKK